MDFGRLTTKRFNEKINFYRHQYALSTSQMGVLGLETEFETASRSGMVDGLSAQTFKSG